MALFRQASVKNKLILTSVLGSGAALLLVGAVITRYDLVSLRNALVQRMSVQAAIVGANAASALLFNDPESAEATLAALKGDPRILAAGLYTEDRRLFATYGSDPLNGARLMEDSLSDARDVHRVSGGRLVLSKGIPFERRTIGTVVIVSDLQEINSSMTRDLVILVSLLLASLLLALVISSRLQRDISQPILDLAQTARRVSQEKDYSVRASGDRRDEIGTLVTAFNEMLSEIRQQEDALRAAHDRLEQRVAERTVQLEAANKELEAFSYSVSHDLRAPLRHIAGFADMLETGSQALDDAGRRCVQKISQAAGRMGQLIDDLLVFSRMGRSEMQAGTVNLGSLLQEVLVEFQPDAKDRSIDWKIGPLPSVCGDRAMLRLVLGNLVSNALKYTGKSANPRIEIGVAQDTDREVVIFVRDNGVGFDMAYASKLFGVFQRLHRADEFEGTGIGLANVQRIIHRHGGRTWAEGQLGRGAAFYFSLPKRLEAAA
jgi:signal transduction histidine kinase